jgi:hypothetical protein
MMTGGVKLIGGGGNTPVGILLVDAGVLVYGSAWIVTHLDLIEERSFGWVLGLSVLLPFVVGLAIYGMLGPKNTK